MTKDKLVLIFSRIDKLTPGHKPLFGRMNVHQMICHCTDQLRMAFGEKHAECGDVNPEEIIAQARAGKSVQTPVGLDQLTGEGTHPVDFEEDRNTLKKYIIRFSELPGSFELQPHPYFPDVKRDGWERLVEYHLNYHLKQFGV